MMTSPLSRHNLQSNCIKSWREQPRRYKRSPVQPNSYRVTKPTLSGPRRPTGSQVSEIRRLADPGHPPQRRRKRHLPRLPRGSHPMPNRDESDITCMGCTGHNMFVSATSCQELSRYVPTPQGKVPESDTASGRVKPTIGPPTTTPTNNANANGTDQKAKKTNNTKQRTEMWAGRGGERCRRSARCSKTKKVNQVRR